MNFRQALLRAVLGAVAVMLVFAGPSFGGAAATHGKLTNFARATGPNAPTPAQRAAVRKLHAKATWNSFGTAATLMKPGGYLTKQAVGATAVAAAHRWLARHKVIYRLDSLSGLHLVADSRLTGGRGHAVTFQQSFEGLKVLNGSGLITVAMVPGKQLHRWKVGFVSSTSLGTLHKAGTVKLTAAQAFVHAAGNLGLKTSLMNVRAQKVARGWTNLRVGGFRDLQRVRLGSYGLGHAAVPAFEAIVLHRAGSTLAYRTIVNARTGAILARTNLTDNFATTRVKHANAIQTFTISGELPATDGACGVRHGPYTVGAGVRALSGFAAATINTNDEILKLFFGDSTTPLIAADTLFSPEQFRYAPAGGVPPGDYFVQNCDFPDGSPWAAPRTYTGTVTIDDSPAPPAYWARWKAFPATPPLATLTQYPWNNPSTDTRSTWCWRSAAGCDIVVGNLASRVPWDFDARTNATTFTTSGNNNKAATAWDNASAPGAPGYMPTSNPARDYSFPWTNDWNNRQCQRAATETPGAVYDDSAAAVNLFVMHNRMHDFSYFLGFTEQNWNGQSSNFGNTEAWQEGDPLIGDVQSGAQTTTRDNANMSTMPDGASSVTNMYFWQPIAGSFYAPCVDGDYDQGVIGHEFGHMIENRMISKGSSRTGFHAGAMGEAFGDMVSTEYLHENNYLPSGQDGYATGTYATGNKVHGIRDYVMNWPRVGAFPEPSTISHINPLNFSDFGFDLTGPEVHADGEMWVAINNSVRQALVDKYDDAFPAGDTALQAECAAGELPSQNCPGNRRWMQLVFDSMLLDPSAPTMIDARNSLLAADVMRYGGANQQAIWHGFAIRGMGTAAAVHASGVSDTDPVADFASPAESNVDVTFDLRAKTPDDGPVVGKVYVGDYEARVTPIADTDPATTNSGIDVNRDETASFVPGEYNFTVVAKGYGFHRFTAHLNGASKNIVVKLPPNWASSTQGATISGDGTTPLAAIDDTEASNWSADGRLADGTLGGIAGKQVTIDLAGTKPQTISDVQVSAMILAGQSRFSALRSFELWACNSKEADCSTSAGFTKVYTSAANAFPADAPRPNAPQLILRDFEVPKFKATHLRFSVVASQCTGGPAYQGEQDADPTATTDCDTNVAVNSTRRFVRVAEIQAFSDDPTRG